MPGGAYPGVMEHPSAAEQEQDDLLSTLEVIEAQPLGTRAEAYAGLHDALARRLESGPSAAPSPS